VGHLSRDPGLVVCDLLFDCSQRLELVL